MKLRLIFKVTDPNGGTGYHTELVGVNSLHGIKGCHIEVIGAEIIKDVMIGESLKVDPKLTEEGYIDYNDLD